MYTRVCASSLSRCFRRRRRRSRHSSLRCIARITSATERRSTRVVGRSRRAKRRKTTARVVVVTGLEQVVVKSFAVGVGKRARDLILVCSARQCFVCAQERERDPPTPSSGAALLLSSSVSVSSPGRFPGGKIAVKLDTLRRPRSNGGRALACHRSVVEKPDSSAR